MQLCRPVRCIMQLLTGSSSAMDDPSRFFGVVQLFVPLFHQWMCIVYYYPDDFLDLVGLKTCWA